MNTDVVVVGAGPTGLALACGLRAAGVAVRVLDSATAPAVTSRALGLQPRGVEVLDRLGALGDLPDRGIPIGRVVINVNGRVLAQLQVGQSSRRLRGPAGLIMSQADIESALRDRLTRSRRNGGVGSPRRRPRQPFRRCDHPACRRHRSLPPAGSSAPMALTALFARRWALGSPASHSSNVSCSPTSTPMLTGRATPRPHGCAERNCSPPSRFPGRTCGG